MGETQKQLEAARLVKPKAAKALQAFGEVCGVGLTRQKGVYAVKVNLERAPDPDAELPREIDGVPIVVHCVGKIHKQRKK